MYLMRCIVMFFFCLFFFFFFQAEDGIRDFCLSRGLGDVYKRQVINTPVFVPEHRTHKQMDGFNCIQDQPNPMYKMPWAQVFIRVVCTPAIGALKQGLELFLSDRTTAVSYTHLTLPTKRIV